MPLDANNFRKRKRDRFPVGIIFRESAKSFLRNRCLESAATLSFFGFLSLIPMLLVVVFLASHFIVTSEWALQSLDQVTREISPVFNDVVVKEVTLMSQRSGWSVLSLLLLFWAATPLAGSLRIAFGQAFGVTQPPVWKGILKDIVAVLLLMFLVLLVMVTHTVGGGWVASWLPSWMCIGRVIRLLIGVLCITIFYVTFIPFRLPAFLYVFGALLSSFLLGMVGSYLGLLTRFNPHYGYAFGSLQTLFWLFVWVYYCFAAVLLVSEIMASIGRREVLALRDLFAQGYMTDGYRHLLRGLLKVYPPGAPIFKEGDERLEMFYVVNGQVKMSVNGLVVEEIKPNNFFGEMAVLTHSRRTSTASAGDEGAEVMVITTDHVENVLRENPRAFKSLLRRLSDCPKASGAQ